MKKVIKISLICFGLVLVFLAGVFLGEHEFTQSKLQTNRYQSKYFGKYLYYNVYGVFHATRHCPELRKGGWKNKAVKVIYVSEEAKNVLPYKRWICPVCFPQCLEQTLDSCNTYIEYTETLDDNDQ